MDDAVGVEAREHDVAAVALQRGPDQVNRLEDVVFSGAAPRTYDHRSDGSHKRVTLHFCDNCGTTLHLSFERFPGFIGMCAGTFDDPNWFARGPATCRHIFTGSAQQGVVLPAGMEIYLEHALRLDGTPNKSSVLEQAQVVTRKG